MYFAGVVDVSNCCTNLMELDISGCWQVTNKSLYALQENLMHMREDNNRNFSLTLGGNLASFIDHMAKSLCSQPGQKSLLMVYDNYVVQLSDLAFT